MNRLAICATAAIFAAPATHGQQAKTYIYAPDGTIAGWVEPLPGGSQKEAIYDRSGKRVGTIEPNLTGSGTRLLSPTGEPLLQTAPDAFGNSADPFAPTGDDSDDAN
jgi:hypothetical protein